jgi:lipopolysaccharide export system permease protein
MMFGTRPAIRQPRSIWLYISSEFTLSFFVCFLFFFFVFFMNQILYMAEQILAKRAPIIDVLRLLFYAMPSFIAISFPFASLVGCLMAVGRMTSENEILIFQASGISLKRVFIPFLALGMAFSLVSFAVNDYFLPLGTINYAKVYRKLIYSTPSLELKSYSVKRFQSATIITGPVKDNVIEGAMIIDKTESSKSRVITASRATLKEGSDSKNVISLELTDAFIMVTDSAKKERFEYSKSDTMVYNILIKDIVNSMGSITPREMSSVDLKKAVDEKEEKFNARVREKQKQNIESRFLLKKSYAQKSNDLSGGIVRAWDGLNGDFGNLKRSQAEKITDKILQNYQREYQKKFSIPFGALCFVIFAFPIGMLAKRSGRSVGFGIGLIVALLYWFMLYWSDAYGNQLKVSPFWLMWFPNIVVLCAGLFFFALRRIR